MNKLNKISYTVSWNQPLPNYNTERFAYMFERGKKTALLKYLQLEDNATQETEALIKRLTCKK